MRTFLIDTDTASDDAVAILMALAAPDVRVAALTTVAGNVGLEQATRNALYTAEIAGSDAPVFKGAAAPLVRRHEDAFWFHGRDGFGDRGYPTPRRAAERENAVDALVRLAHAEPGLTLVTLGPLTNIALALARDPGFAERTGRCVVMGGAPCCEGNVTPAAEYNIWVDPEAARRVFRSQLPIEMIGWHVSRGASVLDEAEIADILALDTPKAHFAINCNARAKEAYISRRRGTRPFARRPHRDGRGARSRDRQELEPAFRRDRMRERSDARHDDRGPSQCGRGRQQYADLARRSERRVQV